MTENAAQWMLSLANYPTPSLETVPVSHRSEAERLLCLARLHMPQRAEDGSGDYEDFMEQAARLDAAITSFGEENVWLSMNEPEAVNLRTHETAPAEQFINKYGIQFSYSDIVIEDYNADSYMATQTFQKHSGRRMSLCGFNPDSGEDIRHVLQEFHHAGHDEVIIKAAAAKKGFWRVPLHEYTDPDMLLMEHLDWSVISHEGRPNAFLVQEIIPMEYEYRVFVVGHAPVTAAGCVEEFTPLNNTATFDPQLRQDRAERSPVVVDEQKALTLTRFAETVATDYSVEQPEVRNYVLDVAFSAGEPIMVERNSLPNSGLYATKITCVTDALRLNA